jgi:hypothetical protein
VSTDDVALSFFLELEADARFERVAHLILTPDERVARRWLVRWALNEHLAVRNDNRGDANANDVSFGDCGGRTRFVGSCRSITSRALGTLCVTVEPTPPGNRRMALPSPAHKPHP